MQRILKYLPILGLTLAWIVPVHFLPWVAWHSEIPVFVTVLITAALGLASVMKSGGPTAALPVPAMAVALLCVGIAACLQAEFGLVRFIGDAWIVLIYAFLCAAAFVLGHAQAKSGGQASAADTLAGTLVVAGVGCTFVALVQAFDVWTASDWIARVPAVRRPGSNLAQPNQMATVVLMAAASLAYLYERARVRRAGATVIGAVLALGLATTESRTGLAGVLALSLWWACKGYPSRIRPIAVVLALAVVLLGYLAWPPALELFYGNAGAELAKVNGQIGLRAIVWPQLTEAILQRPWFGWGVRQTSTALTSVVHAYGVSEQYTYAHNIILELLLGFGVPITLVLIAAGCTWTARRWKAREDLTGWYCMALWVPLLVHSLLEFPYSYAYLLAPAMFALGLLDGCFGVKDPRRLPAAAIAGALAIALGLGAWSTLEYLQIEEDFRTARFEAGRIGAVPTDYQRPRIHLLTQLGAMLDAARIVPTPGMAADRIEFAGDVAARFPWPALQDRYALALALNDQPAAAERELRVMRAMHGEVLFRGIRQNWQALAHNEYPQLSLIRLPD